MKSRIHILDDLTINKIAAGEVVEGPYSVVKELIENAIDAGATSIILEIKEGGKKYIRVSDNGTGILEEEVEKAFLRHATSKISNLDDLNDILTLGFRGEALASIASVSQVELITKTKDQQYGIHLEVIGGKIINKKQVGCPVGTTVIVKNLFFNTPARLKFMKTPQAEATKISEIINRLSLSKPSIGFQYINNNNIMFTTTGNGNLSEAILSVFQKELFKNLIPIPKNNGTLQLEGYISQPNYYRGNRSFEIVFVNGRYIKNKLIYKAIEDAYKGKIPINKYPICILNIQIDPGKIDVNVHPSKTEIKFRDEEEVYHFLNANISATIYKKTVVPKLSIVENKKPLHVHKDEKVYREEIRENNLVSEINNIGENNSSYSIHHEDESRSLQSTLVEMQKELRSVNQEEVEPLQENFIQTILDDYKIIGQLFHTYILIEREKSLYFIDQHAAHERLIYDRFMKEIKEEQIITQKLLQPEVLELTNEDYQILMQYQTCFTQIGFDMESFGQNAVIIREVPVILGTPKNFSFLLEIIDEIKNKNEITEGQYLKEMIAKKACKEAIKAMDKLENSEISQLVKELSQLAPPLTCPHGRPILFVLTNYEIEKYFKRIQ